MRCKEHFQGDLCRKEAHHESTIAITPDPIHAGQFSSWKGEGDNKVKLMQSQKPIIKRHRGMDRLARTGGLFRDPAIRKLQADQLGKYAQYLRQSQ
jgi:hypothetical protein